MDLKKSLVPALLSVAILSAGARAGSAQQVQPIEPEWLRQMYAEGWQKVQEGVLRRATERGTIETFGYGAEGLQWVAQKFEEQAADLKRQHDASPSGDLAELIEQLEGQILRLEGIIDSAPSAESVDGEVLESCTPLYDVVVSADPQTGAQGVTASATAWFRNTCGILGDTFTTAQAQAVSVTGETSITHNDPKNGGTWLESYSTASANGSTGCRSYAAGTVYYPGLPSAYMEEDENFSCGPTGSTPIAAVSGPIAAAPAATLLLPYFEVDLDNSDGVTTLFSVNNAVASAQLAHVTVWSTWSVPVMTFDVYLTGYDVQTFSLRDILVNGFLPQTGSGTTTAANDPGSPLGAFSSGDVAFPSCNTTSAPPNAPVYSIPGISTTFRSHLKALLTGKRSPVDNTCAGTNYGDNIARGYITIDDANSCSLSFPSSPGYFVSGGLGVAGNDNVLWGDYHYGNPAQNLAHGETLVHIPADATAFSTPGEYTFYGRYVGGSAADNRKPLPTSFATRYVNGGGFTGGTDLIVWRDSKRPPGGNCASGPNFGSLDEQQIVVFDEYENPLTDATGGTPCAFCNETQRVEVGGDGLVTNADYGWIYLNLNHATTNDAILGPGYNNIAQAWVAVNMDSEGRFSVGYDAIQLDNANTVANPGGRILPP